MSLIDQAKDLATQRHAGQTRFDGTEYIVHPLRVADTVRQHMQNSSDLDSLIAAALLHDTLEDTDTSYQELEKLFGELVAGLVLEVTSSPSAIKHYGKGDYLLHKMTYMTPYALTIKLADRLDNVTDLKGCTPEYLKRYLAETEYILTNLLTSRKIEGVHLGLIGEILEVVRKG